MTTYKITLNDGLRIDRSARNAADAIQSVLGEHLGRYVTACRSGLNAQETASLRAAGTPAIAGEIHYDIPPHHALLKEPPKAGRKIDRTELMFSENEMKGQKA